MAAISKYNTLNLKHKYEPLNFCGKQPEVAYMYLQELYPFL